MEEGEYHNSATECMADREWSSRSASNKRLLSLPRSRKENRRHV